jgi:hypothetical protein
LLRFSVLLLALVAGCGSSGSVKPIQEQRPLPASPLAGLPASFANTPSCDDCLGLTLTLRPDGAYMVRERLAGSEFYDFGRWREGPDGLLLEGGRDAPRRYALQPPDTLDSLEGTQGGNLRRQQKLEALRGPFRVVGSYDGAAFRECRTGLAWPLGESRPGERLRDEFAELRAEKKLSSLLVVQRPASLLTGGRCPG